MDMSSWHFIDYIGLAGGLFFLFGFWRTSIGQWKGTSFWFEFDNLIGALLMSCYAFSKGAFINIGLNIVWGIVALRGVSSLTERRLMKNPTFRRSLRKAQKKL
jgi:hypothetical protein